MSKLRRSSSHPFKSYLNPLGSANAAESKVVPAEAVAAADRSKLGDKAMHLCHGSSVQCDVVDVLKENVPRLSPGGVRKCRSHHKQHTDCKLEPLMPLSQQQQLQLLNSSGGDKVCRAAALGDSKLHNTGLLGEEEDEEESFSGESTPLYCATPNHRLYVWDEDSAPASAWSTLGNRSLLLRPLPPDVGKCRCYIVREHGDGLHRPSVYSLYTDEGRGRQNRLLAVARHRRKVGRSEFLVAQTCAGTMVQSPDEGYLGNLTANLVGTRYQINDKADVVTVQEKVLQGVVMFEPTVTTLTGDARKMRVVIPKCQAVQVSGSGFQACHGLRKDWEENQDVTELVSKTPRYNRARRRYELDFRESAKVGCKIKSSVKNFQLTIEDEKKQTTLLMGKLSKSTFVMEYRFPLSGYQAFSICLASIDSKLCCTV